VTWEKERGKAPLAHFKFYLNPLVFWIWFGTLVMLLGALITAIPLRKKQYDEWDEQEEARGLPESA
jgi:cytochrome c biogenesis factor